MELSEYRAMWVLVTFDLPVGNKKQRKAAAGFRKILLEDGFWMLQYSVYARPAPSEENANVHQDRIVKALPPWGEVRIIRFTDKQWSRMEIFVGKEVTPTEKQPRQLELF